MMMESLPGWLPVEVSRTPLNILIIGGYPAVILTRSQQQTLPRHIGLALTPQAGIAIGMALLAAEQFPEFRGTILSVVVASTITFELIGPVLVRRVLRS